MADETTQRLSDELGPLGRNSLLVAAHRLAEDFEVEGKVDADLALDERMFVVAVLAEIAPAVERIVAERLEQVAREWQYGGWTILTAPPPPGSVPSLALGQRVTDWLRERVGGGDRG